MTEYYDHPEQSATYFIISIAGNLQREESQPRAESNHSSIHAHLDTGSQGMERHKTFIRISEIHEYHEQINSPYRHQCNVASANSEDYMEDPDLDPRQSMSEAAYTTTWNPKVQPSQFYDCTWLNVGSMCLDDTSVSWTPTLPCKVLQKG